MKEDKKVTNNNKPQLGSNIRCTNGGGYDFLTVGKVYDVVDADDEGFHYIDDDGEEMCYDFYCTEREEFELVEKEATTDIKIGDFVRLKEWNKFF